MNCAATINYVFFLIRYDEADKLLHEALEKAQAKKCEFAIDNIYDNLSLLYMRKGEYSKAEPTIVELMVRLLKNGTHQGAPIIVELSLRLANIYAERGEIEKAEDGMHKFSFFIFFCLV